MTVCCMFAAFAPAIYVAFTWGTLHDPHTASLSIVLQHMIMSASEDASQTSERGNELPDLRERGV